MVIQHIITKYSVLLMDHGLINQCVTKVIFVMQVAKFSRTTNRSSRKFYHSFFSSVFNTFLFSLVVYVWFEETSMIRYLYPIPRDSSTGEITFSFSVPPNQRLILSFVLYFISLFESHLFSLSFSGAFSNPICFSSFISFSSTSQECIVAVYSLIHHVINLAPDSLESKYNRTRILKYNTDKLYIFQLPYFGVDIGTGCK